MRLRPTDYLGLLLSLFLALGIALGAPSAAWAQSKPWTTVGSAGTVDEGSANIVTLDGPNALLTGFRRFGRRGSFGTIRYNIVAVDGVFEPRGAVGMRVRYRATVDPLAENLADSRVLVQLIEVNLSTGISTTRLVLDSNNFPPSNDFQIQGVNTCVDPNFFDFSSNAYYIDVTLRKRNRFAGIPALQTIEVSGDPCLSVIPTASELLAKMTSCLQISNGRFATDAGGPRTVQVCKANGAVWFKADMDIDCDGVPTPVCNSTTDATFQPDTSLHTESNPNQPFNAETMPYVVLPSVDPSVNAIWRYTDSNIALGAVVAVIYNSKVEYGVFADTGPVDIIGEASYAMANALGINPNPTNGGVDSGVTYLVFTGSKVSPVESHAAAVSLGQALARQFINNN